MIAAPDVARIAEKVAREKFGAENVLRTAAEPIVDWTGAEARRVPIVLAPDAVSRITDDAAIDNLVALQKSVQQAGDDRFAVVEYATEEELAKGDDTESIIADCGNYARIW
jgi:hypothetical protein